MRLHSLTALALALTAATATAQTPMSIPTPHRTGHVTANGVNYYYAIYGTGDPLLLLHGGLGQIEMFGPVLAQLAKTRTIIGVDLYGHGRTALASRAVDLAQDGRDMGAILKQLGYDKVDVLGYSLGSGVALQFAAQHPERVRRLALVSSGYSSAGYYPEMRPQQEAVGAGMADMMKDTPMYKSYVAIAPRPQDFPVLLDRMGEFMRRDFDASAQVKQLASSGIPTILIFGDSDMFRLEHVVEMYRMLGGGQRDAGWQREHQAKNRLAILPDLTHYEMFMSPLMGQVALDFLDGKSNAPSWAQQVEDK